MYNDLQDGIKVAHVMSDIASSAVKLKADIVEAVNQNIYVLIGKTIFANYLLEDKLVFNIAEVYGDIRNTDSVDLILYCLKLNDRLDVESQGKSVNFATRELIKRQLDKIALSSLQKFVAIQQDQDNIANMSPNLKKIIEAFLQVSKVTEDDLPNLTITLKQ